MADATAPSSGPPAKPQQHHYLSRADRTIAHANRLLSTTAGLDTTLLTLNYTLVLLHAQLDALTTRRLFPRAHALITKTTATSPLTPTSPLPPPVALPPSSPLLLLLRSSRNLHALAALVADVRVFLRLWGLLGIWSRAAATWRTPARDGVLRALAWGMVAVDAAYQGLENAVYLGEHGVVRVGRERRDRWGLWSARFWLAHVVLDCGRLGWEWVVWGRGEGEEGKVKGKEEGMVGEEGRVEKEGKGERVRDGERWWREVCVNAAYAPLTVHWSLERGCVSEAWVGFLGMVAGVVGLREVCAETA